MGVVLSEQAADGVEAIYTANHSWLVTWLRYRVGCRELAADFAHDTFLRLMARGCVSSIDEPRAFLRTVAKGLMIDFWRKRAIEQAYIEALASLPENCAPSAEEQALVMEELYRISLILSGLPKVVRTVFVLARLDGKSYPAIAEELGISLITVKRYMQRAYLVLAEASLAD
jgi:RNA polymerase sigma-70 factor (ECF subfamily)